MIALLPALLGALAPFIPDLLGMATQALNDMNERKMLALRMNFAGQEHDWRMDEIETRAQREDIKSARRPHASYGVQLLDKAAESQSVVWRWSFNLVFLAFAALDWIISSVRPAISYWAFGLYAVSKTATLVYIQSITGNLPQTLMNEAAFTPFDQDMLLMILGFWFGERIRKRAREGK